MVTGMITGALIALIFFAIGYKLCLNVNVEDTVTDEIEPHLIDTEPTIEAEPTTTEMFRIKHGPKKGLLSYKKARE